MPQLCKEACKNPEPSIKIQALYIISLVTWKLDESYVAANILASLKYITDHEKNPQVSMSVVGNFESISNSLGLNYIAVSILPILQTMLLDTGLDKNQFEMVVNMIKRLLKKILDKRTAELNIPPISVAEIPGSEGKRKLRFFDRLFRFYILCFRQRNFFVVKHKNLCCQIIDIPEQALLSASLV